MLEEGPGLVASWDSSQASPEAFGFLLETGEVPAGSPCRFERSCAKSIVYVGRESMPGSSLGILFGVARIALASSGES